MKKLEMNIVCVQILEMVAIITARKTMLAVTTLNNYTLSGFNQKQNRSRYGGI